jgi:hypothetical protein
MITLLLLALCFFGSLGGSTKVKNFVVVMLENNSFDRVFGTMKGVKGLTGKEFNLNLENERVFVQPAQKFVKMCNPDHSVQATTFKLFGFPVPDFDKNASMGGFIVSGKGICFVSDLVDGGFRRDGSKR